MAREAELGIVSFKPSDNSVVSTSVFSDELALIVSPNHPLAGKSSVSVKELGVETVIAHNAQSPYREKVIETFEKYQTKLNISVELPSLEAIKKLVETGIGVALVPKLTAQSEIDSGQLKALAVKEMKLERKLNIIYRKNSVLSHASKSFLKLAKDMSAYFLEILPTKKKVFEYTYQILDYLTEKKYALHLITNGFEKTQRIKLESSGLTKYFQHIITSEISNSVKPKKEIFEYAVNKAHGKIEESIMIGDNLNADILGAKNAGMDSVFVNHINAACGEEPTYIIRHLKELESIL